MECRAVPAVPRIPASYRRLRQFHRLRVGLCENRAMSSLAGHDRDRRGEGPHAQPQQRGFLRRVGGDLRHGLNIELYVTVTLALCIALLSVFGVVDVKVVSATTLAVLALLAVSGLATRHRSEVVERRLEQVAGSLSGEVPADRFLKTRMPALDEDVASAAQIGLVGVTLARTVRDLLPVLDRGLRRGASIRVLVIDGDGPARIEALARSRGANTPDFYRHRLASTIDLLGVLASAAHDESALQLRLLPYVPTFGMCLVDPAETYGRIHVEIYQHQTIEQNPSFSLRADRDNHWYKLFARQFETLWESGQPYRLTVPE
jgi:hypothetical protein